MPTTILYPEGMYPDDSVERAVYGADVRILLRSVGALAELDEADCGEVEGLLVFRSRVGEAELARFPRLRVLVRMGVGFDLIDLRATTARGIIACNVPDYGTTEVADHAMALALALRRGLILYHDTQRRPEPPPWREIETPLIRRLGEQTFGIVGLGRIGTATALRAKAFGFRVVFFDPYLPSGVDRALGIGRTRTLDELLAVADVLSLHTPLTRQTRGMIGARELALLPPHAVVINTARGAILDEQAVAAVLREGRIAGAGIDVLRGDPPDPPTPLLRAYRGREPWLEGRLVLTPHVAFYSPQSKADIRRLSAETMAAALLHGTPQNVITPDMS